MDWWVKKPFSEKYERIKKLLGFLHTYIFEHISSKQRLIRPL